jgi:membrane protease YdiL (CAAX protease family)
MMDATPRDLPPQPRPAERLPWLSGAGALAATIAVVVASAALPLVLMPLLGVAPERMTSGTNVPGFLAFMAATQVVMLAGTLLVIVLERHRLVDLLALGPPRGGWRDYALGIGLVVSIPLAINVFRHVVLGHDIYADLKPFVALFRNPWWIAAVAVIAIGAPIAEEVLFRGYLLARLIGFGFSTAAIVTTLVWAGLHAYSAWGMALIVIMGVLFADLRRRTGSLRVPIAAHAANNTLACLYLQFGPPIA